MPWKSTTPYKSGSSSTYSSRDDVNASDSKSRFGLSASPAAFRPSYSGGTYRSVKRDTPLVVPLPKNYGSNYTNTSKDTKDTSKSSLASTTSTTKPSSQTSTPKYTGGTSSKNLDPSVSRYSTSTSNLSKYGMKSRDPSPAIDRRPNITVSRAKSRDPSPLGDRRQNTGTFSTSTSNLTKFGHRSRDPSPATSDLRINAGIQNRNLRARSRDPSPVNVQYKSSLGGSSANNYASNYRLGQRCPRTYGSKYGSSGSSSTSSGVPDKALSYMSISDFRARSATRTHDFTKKLEELSINEPVDYLGAEDTKHNESESVDDKEDVFEPEVFIAVTVVTRGTSPTPPGASSIVRTRRLELAKTIEKTIQRSSRKPKCFDKEIQSDRLDDTTRYSRFSSASRLSTSPWSSPYSSEPKFSRSESSKLTTGSGSSSSNSSAKPAKGDSESGEKKKKDESSLSRSNSRNSIKQEKSKTSSESKLSKPSSKQSTNSAKQRSTDNLTNTSSSRLLPPAVPKADSPTKSASTSSGSSRWPNKDFRKSALNVGPTDRPRKSRTPSTGTDTDEKPEQQKTPPAFSRAERSPSVGSEASSSTSSGNSSADDLKHDHQGRDPVTSPDREFDQTQENIIFGAEQVPKDNSYGESGYNKSFGMCGDRGPVVEQSCEQHDVQNFRQIRSPNAFPPSTGVDSSPAQLVAKTEDAKSILIRKLGSISNFFVTRNQEDPSGEAIYLDSSSGGSGPDASITGVLKEDALTTTASVSKTQSQVLNPTVAVTSNTNSDLDESSWWQNTSQQIDTESALDLRDDMKYKLRHIDSGEIAWWMRNDNDRDPGDNGDDTIADDLKTLNQQNDFDTDPDRSDRTDRLFTNEIKRSTSRDVASWWPTSNSESPLKERSPRIKRIESGERAWWLTDSNEGQENELVVSSPNENNRKNQKLDTVTEGSMSQFQTNGSASDASSRGSNYNNRSQYPNQKLGTVNENVVSQYDKANSQVDSNSSQYKIPWWMTDTSQDSEKKPQVFKIRHNESGERAWWLSDSNESSSRNGVQQPLSPAQGQQASRQSTPKMNPIKRIESGEVAWWLQDDSAENQSQNIVPEDEEVKQVSANYYKHNISHPLYDSSYGQIPPLGDRRSPEGLEDTSKDRKSPYHNNKTIRNGNHKNSNCNNNTNITDSNIPTVTVKLRTTKAPTTSEKLFISRHTNIDDLLGGSCRALSPILNRFNGGHTGGKADMGFFFEEISPQQVRIHDSTAQMPVIQRMGRDEWDYAGGNQFQKNQNRQDDIESEGSVKDDEAKGK